MPEYNLVSKRRSFFLVVLLATGYFYIGYCCTVFNPLAQPVLIRVFDYDENTEKSKIDHIVGRINALFAAGAIFGGFVIGLFAQRVGRKKLLYTAEIISIANCLLYLIKSMPSLILARFISGIVSGMVPIGSIIITELFPNWMSGVGNAICYIMNTFGILAGLVTHSVLSENDIVEYWREILIFPIVISTIRLAFLPLFLRTDTPRYEYERSISDDEAYDRIRNIYSNLIEQHQINQATFDVLKTYKKQPSLSSTLVGMLTTRVDKLKLISGCFLSFAQQMSGISFFFFYSTRIFDDINGSGKSVTLIIGITNVLGGFVATYLIGSFGRKVNFLSGTVLQGLSLLILLTGISISSYLVLFISAVTYMLAYSIGLGGSFIAYLCETLPPIGIAISLTIQWTLIAFVGYFSIDLDDLLGESPILGFFAVANFFLFIGLAKWTIETKGKSENQINDKFRGKLRIFDFS